MSFQENLRRCREAAGFSSARAFAEHMGIPYTTYISYENKDREPKYDTLCRIATALHVSTDELLGLDSSDVYKRKYEELKAKLDSVVKIIEQR